MQRLRRHYALILLMAALPALFPLSAHADNGWGEGGGRPGAYLAKAKHVQYSGSYRLPSGNVTVAAGSYKPPLCYWAPWLTLDEWWNSYIRSAAWRAWRKDPEGGFERWDMSKVSVQLKIQENERSNFVVWSIECSDYSSAAAQAYYDSFAMWARIYPKGSGPPPGEVIPTRMLAMMAEKVLVVPETKLQLNPARTSVVNLNTWVWAEPGQPGRLSATASIPYGPSATVYAERQGLRIEEPGGPAVTYPIGADGQCVGLGEPYAAAKEQLDPPCGVDYTHASVQGPYSLTAAIVWRARWTGSDGQGGALPSSTLRQTEQIPVEEVQTVVTTGG